MLPLVGRLPAAHEAVGGGVSVESASGLSTYVPCAGQEVRRRPRSHALQSPGAQCHPGCAQPRIPTSPGHLHHPSRTLPPRPLAAAEGGLRGHGGEQLHCAATSSSTPPCWCRSPPPAPVPPPQISAQRRGDTRTIPLLVRAAALQVGFPSLCSPPCHPPCCEADVTRSVPLPWAHCLPCSGRSACNGVEGSGTGRSTQPYLWAGRVDLSLGAGQHSSTWAAVSLYVYRPGAADTLVARGHSTWLRWADCAHVRHTARLEGRL